MMYLNEISFQIPSEAMLLSSKTDNPIVTIYTQANGYIFCNRNWQKLFNLSGSKQLINKKDDSFTANHQLIKKYDELYHRVFDSEKAIQVSEFIEPKNRPGFKKKLTGVLFPLYLNSDKSNALMGILAPENKLLSLNLEVILQLSNLELDELLARKSYQASANQSTYSFSKREIQCLIGLFKGKHAGEIALDLHIKQKTVEILYRKS